MRKQTPESAVLKQITDWLTANRIWHERRNTGAVVQSYGGKTRMTRFSRPGTADIMALVCTATRPDGKEAFWPIWIECKAPKGRQSDLQKQFQADVEAAGHTYILAFDVSDVIEALA